MNIHSFTWLMTTEQNDKRELILATTKKLISIHGLNGLSMQKLAQEAGVAAGTIYRYFKDKDHLIEETRLYVTQKAADAIQAGISDDMPLKQRYRTMWMNIWNLASQEMSIKSHIQFEQRPCAEQAKLYKRDKGMFAKVNRFFEEGKAQGLFKPYDNEILSALSLETSVTLARKQHQGYCQLTMDDLEQIIEASWDALIKHQTQ